MKEREGNEKQSQEIKTKTILGIGMNNNCARQKGRVLLPLT
jgi:hypothetical protein